MNCLPRVIVMSIGTVAETFPVAIRDDRLLVCPWIFDRSLLDLSPRVHILKSDTFRTKSGTYFHIKTNNSILHNTDNKHFYFNGNILKRNKY